MQTFQKGANGNVLNFPLTASSLAALQPSSLASPRVGNPHSVSVPAEFTNLQPWADEIEKVRAEVSRNEFPRWWMEKYYPSAWGTFPQNIPGPLANERLSFHNPKGLADVVHMDHPLDLGQAILGWLLSNGYKPTKETTTGHNEFLDKVCDASRGFTTSVTNSLDKAFEVKYHFGVARPEEVLDYNMTHYPEGCPTHPSFPAGHGAAAGGTAFWFLNNFITDTEAEKVIRDSAYIWAMARSLAGVHYAQDNLAGLYVGGMTDVTYSGFNPS